MFGNKLSTIGIFWGVGYFGPGWWAWTIAIVLAVLWVCVAFAMFMKRSENDECEDDGIIERSIISKKNNPEEYAKVRSFLEELDKKGND